MVNDTKTIRFEMKDSDGNHYLSESTFSFFEDDLTTFGRQFNTFLKQLSYIRENDYIFMEDITEDEYDYLADCLTDYREGRTHEENNKERNG